MLRSLERSPGWTGYCSSCAREVRLSIRKVGGRWTLRELFTSEWEDSDFDIVCGTCAATWPAELHGSGAVLSDWLEVARSSVAASGDRDVELPGDPV